MTRISIESIRKPNDFVNKRRFALFNFGFRPFFLFGAVYGVFVIGYFILMMAGMVSYLPSHFDMIHWHRHEMLFGFTNAIIAGFLFTAVAHWSGQETPRQLKLMAIVLLWLLGRFLVFFSSYWPAALSMAVDVSFPIVCAILLLFPLLKSHNRRNYFFIALLTFMTLASCLDYFESMDVAHMYDGAGIRMTLGIITFMMVVVGGRVIPLFTQNITGIKIKEPLFVERGAIVLTLASALADIFIPSFLLLPFVYLGAAVMISWRLLCWREWRVLSDPLLWILHLGYLWIAISFVLSALKIWHIFDSFLLNVHALTAGAIGCLTLGIMTRASLGHTGRLLVINSFMKASLYAVALAGIVRVVMPMIFPSHIFLWLIIAAALWMIAFSIFALYFTPILFRPSLGASDE